LLLKRSRDPEFVTAAATGRKRRASVYLYLIHRYLYKMVIRDLLPLLFLCTASSEVCAC
jgi:hypothetical protein